MDYLKSFPSRCVTSDGRSLSRSLPHLSSPISQASKVTPNPSIKRTCVRQAAYGERWAACQATSMLEALALTVVIIGGYYNHTLWLRTRFSAGDRRDARPQGAMGARGNGTAL